MTDISNFVETDGKITPAGVALVEQAIHVLNVACFLNSKAHGWYEKYTKIVPAPYLAEKREILRQRNFGEVIALITSEASEAFEAYRDGDNQTRISYGYKSHPDQLCYNPIENGVLGKPKGIAAELADVLIRVFDYAGAYGVPLGEAIIRKHAYNQTRPYRHEGKLA